MSYTLIIVFIFALGQSITVFPFVLTLVVILFSGQFEEAYESDSNVRS